MDGGGEGGGVVALDDGLGSMPHFHDMTIKRWQRLTWIMRT